MLRSIRLIGLLILLVTAISCKKDPGYDLEPKITFVSISKTIEFDDTLQSNIDVIRIAVQFEDGDGDLGMDINQSIQEDDEFKNNYHYKVFKKVNGIFEPLDTLFGRFEPLAPTVDYQGPIDGELVFNTSLSHADIPPIEEPNTKYFYNDTIKYVVSVIDRAHNKSNEVETGEIIIFQK